MMNMRDVMLLTVIKIEMVFEGTNNGTLRAKKKHLKGMEDLFNDPVRVVIFTPLLTGVHHTPEPIICLVADGGPADRGA